MGIFDFLKNTSKKSEPIEQLYNNPELLTTQLLFFEKPQIDVDTVLTQLKSFYKTVEVSSSENTLLFFFPEILIHFSDASVPAQLSILNAQGNEISSIQEGALQQNWHWKEAAQVAGRCKYEIVVNDLMTRTLDYKIRLNLYMNFLVALIKATNPQVVHSLNSNKLLEPEDFVSSWTSPEKSLLHGLTNVRLFNISNGKEGEILMDTLGMHSLGLPDFQIKFTGIDESEIAGLLWDYAYYTYDKGDTIQSRNTVKGVGGKSKWKVERQLSLVDPERVVIDIQTN